MIMPSKHSSCLNTQQETTLKRENSSEIISALEYVKQVSNLIEIAVSNITEDYNKLQSNIKKISLLDERLKKIDEKITDLRGVFFFVFGDGNVLKEEKRKKLMESEKKTLNLEMKETLKRINNGHIKITELPETIRKECILLSIQVKEFIEKIENSNVDFKSTTELISLQNALRNQIQEIKATSSLSIDTTPLEVLSQKIKALLLESINKLSNSNLLDQFEKNNNPSADDLQKMHQLLDEINHFAYKFSSNSLSFNSSDLRKIQQMSWELSRKLDLFNFSEMIKIVLSNPKAQSVINKVKTLGKIIEANLADLHEDEKDLSALPYTPLQSQRFYLIPKSKEILLGIPIAHLGEGKDKIVKKVALIAIDRFHQLKASLLRNEAAFLQSRSNIKNSSEEHIGNLINQAPLEERDKILAGHTVAEFEDGTSGSLEIVCDGTLETLKTTDTNMTSLLKSDLLLKMLQACMQLKNLNIVHRDLHPENWLFKKETNKETGAEDINIYITDFSSSDLSTPINGEGPTKLASSYLPLNLVWGRERISPAVGLNDLQLNTYQTAITAYQLFTNQTYLPWHKISHAPPESLEKYVEEYLSILSNINSWPGFNTIPVELQNILKEIIVGNLKDIPALSDLIERVQTIKKSYAGIPASS